MSYGDREQDDQAVAVAGVRAGAVVVREMFGSGLARFDKGAGDFATEADIDAERAILEVLRTARPGDAVRGEESGQTGAADARRTWLVDPLCGTLNYASGGRIVAVNVALLTGDEVTAAAVADPFGGEVFWVGADGGAYHAGAYHAGDHHAVGDLAAAAVPARTGGLDSLAPGPRREPAWDSGAERLRPSAAPGLVDVNLDVPMDQGEGVRLLGNADFRRLFRPRVLSSTLALAWVAAGRRAAYVTAGDVTGSVHFAAGIALCRAAGCVVSGLDGGPPGAGGLLAAADRETHDVLLRLTRAAVAR